MRYSQLVLVLVLVLEENDTMAARVHFATCSSLRRPKAAALDPLAPRPLDPFSLPLAYDTV